MNPGEMTLEQKVDFMEKEVSHLHQIIDELRTHMQEMRMHGHSIVEEKHGPCMLTGRPIKVDG